MTRFLALGLAVAALAGGCSFASSFSSEDSASGTATAVAPPPGFVSPPSIAFFDERRGVLAYGRSILVTSDGGRSWRRSYRAPSAVTWVATAGHEDAWALACSVPGCARRTLLASKDGGASWKRLATTDLASVSFAGERTGWGVGEVTDRFPADLFRTADGGSTWQRVRAPCPRGLGSPVGVSFVSETRGWILCVGEPGAGQQAKGVYTTRDGGVTWRPTAVVRFGSSGGRNTGLGGYGYPQGLMFRPTGTGAIWESRGTILTTHDGGRHWAAAANVEPEVDFGESLWLVSDRLGYAILAGREERIVKTTDGGRTWQVVSLLPA